MTDITSASKAYYYSPSYTGAKGKQLNNTTKKTKPEFDSRKVCTQNRNKTQPRKSQKKTNFVHV